tara:strand:+ start:162 stop:695 length:534 start_codon:yes stop_codon:yes gene_type:complete
MQIKKGAILLADPQIDDPEFFKSVILIVHCNDKEVIGIILNKPSKEYLKQIPNSKENLNVNIGGPVDQKSLLFIHKLKTIIPGSTKIKDDYYFGGDYNILSTHITKKNINRIFIYLGYTGWTKNQLISEIKEKSWILLCEYDLNKCFNKKNIWSSIIKTLGDKYAIWTNTIKNPNLN